MTVHFYFENIRKIIVLIRKNVCILSEKKKKKKIEFFFQDWLKIQ